MILSRQLPVYSPLTLGAVAASLGAADSRDELAAAIARSHGSDAVLLLASGTAALTLALLAAAEARPGRPCVLPGYACYDLVSAAVGAGTPVRLYDLDPRTLAPDAASLERALAGGAAALVVVHHFGVPVPMDRMRAAAEAAGAMLIEDAAQGTGGAWGGRPLGAWGDAGILSFGRGKGETGGGGGALLLRRAELVPAGVRARIGAPEGATLPFALRLAAQWALGRPWLYGIPASIPMLRLGETIYRPPAPIRAMHPASARVLARTRPLAREEADVRRAHAARLGAVAGPTRGVSPPAGGTPGWLRFPLVPSRALPPDETAVKLGVQRGYPLPLAELPAVAPLLRDVAPMPGAMQLARTLVTLPTHARLREPDLVGLERWLGDLPR